MKGNKKQGVSIIEIMVVLVIITPLFTAAWNALVGGRMSEKTTKMTAAIQGANQLQRYLEIDLASLDTTLGDEALVITSDSMTLQTMKPKSIAGTKRGVRETITYEFISIASKTTEKLYRIKRNGRKLNSVVLSEVELTIEKLGLSRWVKANIATVDPGLKNVNNNKYQTSILVALPQSFKASFLVDYTVD